MYIATKATYSKVRKDLECFFANLILNQTNEFSLEDIIQQAMSKLSNPTLYSCEELKSVCTDTLQTLYHFDLVQLSCKGKYTLSSAYSTVSAR